MPTRSPAKDWRFNPHCGRSEKDIGTVCKQATWLSTTPKMLGFDPGSFPTGQPVPQALPVFGHEGDTNVAQTLREGYERDTVVVRALRGVYEHYAMSARRAGGPESVCVNVGYVWGVVEKVGQGARMAC